MFNININFKQGRGFLATAMRDFVVHYHTEGLTGKSNRCYLPIF